MRSLTSQTIKIFWQHARRYHWQFFFIVIGVLAHSSFQAYTPLLYKDLIDALSLGAPDNLRPIIAIVWMIFFVGVARTALSRVYHFINNNFQSRVMADLNNTGFDYLHRHSFDFFSSNFVGSLVTKVRRFERSFETIADQLTQDLGRTAVDTVLMFGVLFWQSWLIGTICLVWGILYLLFSYFFSIYKLPIDIKRARIDSRVTAQMADSITNNYNIKLFSGLGRENSVFSGITKNQYLIRRKSWNLGTSAEIVQGFSMIALELVVMYNAVKLWQGGVITIGTIALIQSYFFRLFDKFWSIGKNIRNIYEAVADANEMTEILLAPHEVKDVRSAKILEIKTGAIQFQKVDFTYRAGMEVLRDFNLDIRTGERVALIGPSGGGKSTIVKLLFRFYDLQGGKISIDGQNIAKVTQDSLRANIALVPQEPILFHRSLLDNIRYARPDAADSEVVKAAKLAHAHEFISRFPEGYETFVGERGMKLSGGERQRVAIARAILKDAPILVLDEATSSLDSESEMFIQDALKKLMKNRTTIVIAHRLSTIMQMDRIIVMENGRIMEEGSHDELLKVRQGVYQRLWNIQAGGFAAA